MSLLPGARAAARSLRLYHAPGRAAALDGFYRRFLAPGDRAFDIGAHAGDRTACFRRLGAAVVAVEPQPAMARLLRHLFGRDAGVALVQDLVGAAPGTASMWVNSRNPTISTASPDFIAAAEGAAGWEGQDWDTAIERRVTTLDALAATHGRPDFIKIDVEGFEAEVLAGLSFLPRALSFEFTTIQRGVARNCLDRLQAAGFRAFNACLGETMDFAHAAPIGAADMAEWIAALPHAANSGDVYAARDAALLAPR